VSGEHDPRNPLPKTAPDEGDRLKGVVRPQWVRCGKPNCRCASGERADLHGPYYYRFWREGGRLRKRYVPRKEVEAVRSACRRRQEEQRAERARRDEWRASTRRLFEYLDLLIDLSRPKPRP
jgi:hypothetical protein